MKPGSVSGRVGEQMSQQNSGEGEVERGYCSGETAAFQKSRLVDPERSGNAWHRAERGDLADSFDR
jgi:hypothetical protein